jgi:hypothetical protein
MKLEWGAKRSCLNCGARFYDLQKSSAACPKCGTVYEIQAAPKSRRGKAAVLDYSKDLLDDTNDLDLVADVDSDEILDDSDDLDDDLDDIDVGGGDSDEN